jgi:hypothetical protein
MAYTPSLGSVTGRKGCARTRPPKHTHRHTDTQTHTHTHEPLLLLSLHGNGHLGDPGVLLSVLGKARKEHLHSGAAPAPHAGSLAGVHLRLQHDR